MSKSHSARLPAKKHLYLKKASDELVSHCTCDDAPITFPPQMDCPWCGCGWLFCCANCRKAFTFAVAVELHESWEATAMRDLGNRAPDFKPTEDDIAAWVEAMQELCSELEVGQEYVYLDGWFIPRNSEGIEVEGMHSYHELDCVPQVVALQDKAIVEEVLSNQEYWTKNEVPQDEDEHDEYDDDEDEDEDDEDR
jgi:hypothetical protein